MSQFRIKNIDNAEPDEWVFKTNEGLNSVGDDIDARDPNELAEAIFDTQELLLKVSTLPRGAILKNNSGLAERITILEDIAGNSTLQDIYSNGNTISVLAGKPLTFGIREEFKLDDAGNLSFSPVTMKVKGTGFSTLDFTNASVTTNLGNLLVGATSPGFNLTLRSEEFMYLKDVFLTNGVTLSEPGSTSLETTSQSLVGAINELKQSSFNTSFQAVYSQSTPPRLTTNSTQGGVVIEDPNPSSISDTLRIIGNLNVTKLSRTSRLRVGNNTTLEDGLGYESSDSIKTTSFIEAPTFSSGTNELVLEDKRLSVPLSDSTTIELETSKKNLVGAINELRNDILTVGGFTSLFEAEHDDTTGQHKIITTQADIGDDATKRIIVLNQNSEEKFSVNALGQMISASALIGGYNVLDIINQLNNHLADDGTSHAAVSTHLSDPNPHNTVKDILGLNGSIFMSSSDNSLTVSTIGNTIDIKANSTADIQSVYDNAFFKRLDLDATGLTFRDAGSTNNILTLGELECIFNTDLFFQGATPKIHTLNGLEIVPTDDLLLRSDTGDVDIKTVDANKKVKIQDIDFNEAGAQDINPVLGTSVLGAFKKVSDDLVTEITNNFTGPIDYFMPMYIDPDGMPWPHIANFHPANEFVSGVDFYWQNKGALFYPKETIAAGDSGVFYTSGTHNITASTDLTLPGDFRKGAKLYPITLGYLDIQITDITAMADEDSITFDGVKSITAVLPPTSPNFVDGDFALSQDVSLSDELNSDKTRDNMIATLNEYSFSQSGDPIFLRAGIWGEAASFTTVLSAAISDGDSFTITMPPELFTEALPVTLTAKNTPTAWTHFPAANSAEESAINLADAINKTMFRGSSAIATQGHMCKAKANGATVRIEWYRPGLSGRLAFTQTNSADISTGSLTGGTCALRVYDMEPSRASSIPVTSSISGVATLTGTFLPKESATDYFITAEDALSSRRYSPHYEARELGTIEAVSGSLITMKIKE